MALAEKLRYYAQRVMEPHNVPREPTKASVREGEVREEYDVLRNQKPLPGARPAPPPKVAWPQAAVTVSCVDADSPLLVARAADRRNGAGYSGAPFVWAHSERRPAGPDDRHQFRGGCGERNALRGQHTPPLGVRPGILAEPGPQTSDRSRRLSSGDGMPTVALPSLAGSAGEAVDGAALVFLTSRALAAQEEEEEEQKQAQVKKLEERRRRQRRQALEQEFLALLDIPAARRSAQQAARLSELVELDEAEGCSRFFFLPAGEEEEEEERRRRTRRTRFSTATVSSTSVCAGLAPVSRRTSLRSTYC